MISFSIQLSYFQNILSLEDSLMKKNHFQSLSAFTFLFLESLCIAQQLIESVRLKFTEKIPILVLSGFIGPLIYLCVVIPLTYNDLIPNQRKV